jgi:hypothetical protein
MGLFTAIGKKLKAARFKRNDLRIIQLIQTETIHSILNTLVSEGWEVASQFDSTASLDARGECIVRRGHSSLEFTLLAKNQGEIVGPARIVNALAKQYELVVQSSP